VISITGCIGSTATISIETGTFKGCNGLGGAGGGGGGAGGGTCVILTGSGISPYAITAYVAAGGITSAVGASIEGRVVAQPPIKNAAEVNMLRTKFFINLFIKVEANHKPDAAIWEYVRAAVPVLYSQVNIGRLLSLPNIVVAFGPFHMLIDCILTVRPYPTFNPQTTEDDGGLITPAAGL